MIKSDVFATSAVASCPAPSGAPVFAVPSADVERVWGVRVRTAQAPLSGSVQGTRMPILGSQAQPVGAGVNRPIREVNKIHLTVPSVPSTVKLATTGATIGVIPGRTWSPPD